MVCGQNTPSQPLTTSSWLARGCIPTDHVAEKTPSSRQRLLSQGLTDSKSFVNVDAHAATEATGLSISAAMLSATRAADVFTDSRARWAWRTVVCTCRCPSSFPIIVRLSPRASAREAKHDEGLGSARPPDQLACALASTRAEYPPDAFQACCPKSPTDCPQHAAVPTALPPQATAHQTCPIFPYDSRNYSPSRSTSLQRSSTVSFRQQPVSINSRIDAAAYTFLLHLVQFVSQSPKLLFQPNRSCFLLFVLGLRTATDRHLPTQSPNL